MVLTGAIGAIIVVGVFAVLAGGWHCHQQTVRGLHKSPSSATTAEWSSSNNPDLPGAIEMQEMELEMVLPPQEPIQPTQPPPSPVKLLALSEATEPQPAGMSI